MSITARAVELEELLRTEDVRVTVDVRNLVPPCVLVVPSPRRTWGTLAGESEVVWSIVAMAPLPADLAAAEELELLVDHVSSVLPIETAEPATYQTPGSENNPLPAYLMTFTEYAS